MLEIIFFYLFSGSIILNYGVGLKQVLTFKKNPKCFFKDFFKTLFIAVFTTCLTYVLNELIFVRLGIIELYPFFMTVFFVAFSFGLHTLVKTKGFDLTENYIVPFMIVLMSLTEGFSFVSTILICLSGVFSFYIFILLAFSLRNRFKIYGKDAGERPFFMLLISMAVIFFAVYGFNASWLTLGLNS